MKSLYQRLIYKGYALIENTLFKHFLFFTKKNTLLLIRMDSIGDYILFRNFLHELKASEKFKGYKITLCGNNWWKDLAENLDAGSIDRFIWVDYGRLINDKYRFQLHKKIFLSRFETVIHPTYSRDIHVDRLFEFSGAKHRIGYDGDTINLSQEIKENNNTFYTKLLKSVHNYRFEFYRNKDFFEFLLDKKLLLNNTHIQNNRNEENSVAFFPGAKDAFRRWKPENFAQLATLLNNRFPALKIIICGSQADSKLAAEIMRHTAVPLQDLTGKYDLIQLLDIISPAKLVVANDSGPFHLAVALNRNVVGVSNGNNYGRFTPYPEEMKTHSIVLYPQQILSYSEEQRLQKFHKMVTTVDINEITVDEVYSTIINRFKMNEC